MKCAAEWQLSVTGLVQLSAAGRLIKPGTYFNAGPELTIEEHCRIGAASLQDTTSKQTDKRIREHADRHTDSDSTT